MEIKEAIKILENHNKWRLGKTEIMFDPKKITKTIEIIINEIKKRK